MAGVLEEVAALGAVAVVLGGRLGLARDGGSGGVVGFVGPFFGGECSILFLQFLYFAVEDEASFVEGNRGKELYDLLHVALQLLMSLYASVHLR